MDILPYIITALSAIGTFEGILQTINSKKTQKYVGYANQVIRVIDSILVEHPDYTKSQLDHLLNLAIDVTNDGKLTLKDYAPLKKFILSTFDVREYLDKKQNIKSSEDLSINEIRIKETLKKEIKPKND